MSHPSHAPPSLRRCCSRLSPTRRIVAEEFSMLLATGWLRAFSESSFRFHGSQHVSEWDGCETGGVIGQTIGNDQSAAVDQSATSINDIRDVAFTLVLVRLEQGFAKPSNHFAGIIAIEQERADAVLSHRADTM